MATPHNNAPKGAFAKTVLMPGDPLRAKFIADNFLTDVEQVNTVRNAFGYTGKYKGVPVSVQASGMGQPSIGIYSWELFTEYGVENIIRVGSAGSYRPWLDVQDVFLAETAFSDSNYALIQSGYKEHVNEPSKHINEVVKAKAQEMGVDCKVGRVHSSDVFYSLPGGEGWQEIAERSGCDCVEMESFALFANAAVLGKNAACLLTISDSFVSKKALSAEDRQNSFLKMMELALETAIAL